MKKEFEELLEKLRTYLFRKLYEGWVAPDPAVIDFGEYANDLCSFYSEFENFLHFLSDDTVDDAVENADEDFPF